MRHSSPYRPLAFAAVLAAGAALYWLWHAPNVAPPPPRPQELRADAPPTPEPATNSLPPTATSEPDLTKSDLPTITVPVGNGLGGDGLPATLTLQTGELPWETEINEILRRKESPTARATMLLALLNRIPVQGRSRAVSEALALLPNESYTAVAMPYLQNPQTSGQVLAQMFEDVMDRPESINLPALLAVLRTPGHPFADPARQNLDAALQTDLGNDWAAWDAAIRSRLNR